MSITDYNDEPKYRKKSTAKGQPKLDTLLKELEEL
jgi:hypothetical protein